VYGILDDLCVVGYSCKRYGVSCVIRCVFRLVVYLVCILSNPNLLLGRLRFRGVSVLIAGYINEFML
jgi:hypothetical protein